MRTQEEGQVEVMDEAEEVEMEEEEAEMEEGEVEEKAEVVVEEEEVINLTSHTIIWYGIYYVYYNQSCFFLIITINSTV